MNFRKRVLAAFALALAVSAVVALKRPQDPLISGRPASAWALDLLSTDYRVRDDAQTALRSNGQAALPQIRRLLRKSSRPWKPYVERFPSLLPFLRGDSLDPGLCRQRGAEMVVQLGSSGGSLAPELVESLGYPQAAPESERALMRLGDPAVRALIGGLRARSTDVRAQAARVLRQFLPEHAVCITPLIRALGDPRSNVRKEAASSLGEARAEQDQVMRALLPRSRDDSAEVRAAVLASLGRLRANSPEAMDVLRAGLSDLIPLVRLEAAKALWTLTEDAAVVVPVLSGVLPTQEGWQAAYALGNIGPAAAAAVPALIEVLKREKVPRAFRTPPSSAFALGQIQEPAIPALKEVLRDRQPGARMAAVLAFNFMGKNARGAVPDLAALLRDPEAEIRNVTAITLAGAGADKTLVLAGLEECLHAEDIYLRSTAAALLREIAPERDWAVSPE